MRKRQICILGLAMALSLSTAITGCSGGSDATLQGSEVSGNKTGNEAKDTKEIKALITDFMDKSKAYDKSMSDCLKMKDIAKRGSYIVLWDNVFVDDQENGEYYKAFTDNAKNITYETGDINVDGDSATGTVSVTYNDISKQVCDADDWIEDNFDYDNSSDAEYNNAVDDKINELLAETPPSPETKDVEFALVRRNGKWIIYNTVSFDSMMIDILTGNVRSDQIERYGSFDRASIKNEDGSVKEPETKQLGEKIDIKDFELSFDSFETGLLEYSFGDGQTLNMGDGLQICKAAGMIKDLLGKGLHCGQYGGVDMMYTELIIDDKYHYHGAVTTQDSVDAEVIPGQEKPLYAGFGVPVDVAENASSIEMMLGIGAYGGLWDDYIDAEDVFDYYRFRYRYDLKKE